MMIPQEAQAQREQILAAFMAQHGIPPDRCEQVCMADAEGRVVYYVRERRDLSEASSTVIDNVIRLVCENHGSITLDAITSKSRRQDHVTARNIVSLILREHYGLSLHDCGAAINRHHASVLHGIRRIKQDMLLYSDARRTYMESCAAIGITPIPLP